jgi:DNA-binding winged helix-turn-helix (wHTH) protein/tetratricopeptide (TPR) repeat protein
LIKSFCRDLKPISFAMNQIYEFGDFRVHPAEQLLLYKGQPVALTPKVFETLVILLESDGRLIDKNDFIDKLWPGVFVEDVALAQNISHLRKALDDGTNGAPIIQTVPKRGYRFVPAVRRITDEATELPQTQSPRPPARPDSTDLIEDTKSGAMATGLACPKRSNRNAFAIAVLLLACGVGAFLYSHSRRKALSETDTVVLADFDNFTGDPVFDSALRQGTEVQLQQSPFLSLVTDARIQQILQMMGQPADARLTPAIAREVCTRNGSTAILEGSIAPIGSQYVLGVRATDCRSRRVLAEEQVQAARKEDVLKSLDQIVRKARSRLGESLVTVEKFDTPLVDATTPSLDALNAYSMGQKKYAEGEQSSALSFYHRATELDPNFAMAYAALGAIYYAPRHEPERAAENIRKAYELKDKVSEWEKLSIEGRYYLIDTGELEKAAQTFELWKESYPREYYPHAQLSIVNNRLGKNDKALEEARVALDLGPHVSGAYQVLASDYVSLNRLRDAEAVYKLADERKLPHFDGRLRSRYLLAFLQGDAIQMAQFASAAIGKPGEEDPMLAAQSDTEAWYGRFKNARELVGRAMDSAQRNDAKETAAAYQAAAALYEADSGNLEQARADADAAMTLATTRNVKPMAALALARIGDSITAEKLAAELDKDFHLDTKIQMYWLPAIHAANAIERKDPGRAIELLQAREDIEVGEPSIYPAYLRGEAYLMLRDGNRAATEFQKYIDHYGVVRNSPWGALARLDLARAYAAQGDTVKARAAYQNFLTIWKDADPNVPLLQQAKAEYANLR